MQLSRYGLLLLTQPLQSSEQHIRANLEFLVTLPVLLTWSLIGNPSWLKTNLGFCRRRPISVGSGGQLGQVLSQQFQDDAVIFKRKEN